MQCLTGAGAGQDERQKGKCTPPSATPKKAASPAVMPSRVMFRRRCPLKPNTFLATQLVVAPHSASRAASGPRLPPAHSHGSKLQPLSSLNRPGLEKPSSRKGTFAMQSPAAFRIRWPMIACIRSICHAPASAKVCELSQCNVACFHAWLCKLDLCRMLLPCKGEMEDRLGKRTPAEMEKDEQMNIEGACLMGM